MARLFTRRRRFFNATATLAGTAYALPNLLLKGQDAAGKRLNIARQPEPVVKASPTPTSSR